MEILNSCPICKGQKFKPFLLCTDFTVSRETFQIVECESCNFHFTNPRPNEIEITRYYQSEDYISHTGTSKGLVNRIYLLVRKYTLAKKLQLVLEENFRGNSSKLKNLDSLALMDYGCGTGEFLKTCKDAGIETTGIEPGEKAREFGINKYDLNILNPDKIKTIPSETFDIVTLWHVLEHIHQIEEFLNNLKRLLKKTGVAIIAVPNFISLDSKIYKENWAAFDVPRHLYHFSPKDMVNLMDGYDFKLEKTKPMIFDAFYVSMLSEKYKNSGIGKNNMVGNLISGFFSGLKSNVSAIKNENSYSSLIYFFKKRH